MVNAYVHLLSNRGGREVNSRRIAPADRSFFETGRPRRNRPRPFFFVLARAPRRGRIGFNLPGAPIAQNLFLTFYFGARHVYFLPPTTWEYHLELLTCSKGSAFPSPTTARSAWSGRTGLARPRCCCILAGINQPTTGTGPPGPRQAPGLPAPGGDGGVRRARDNTVYAEMLTVFTASAGPAARLHEPWKTRWRHDEAGRGAA